MMQGRENELWGRAKVTFETPVLAYRFELHIKVYEVNLEFLFSQRQNYSETYLFEAGNSSEHFTLSSLIFSAN